MWKKIPPLTDDDARATDRLLSGKARLLIDENIGKLAGVLRELGWDAVSAHEVGLGGHSDEDLFAAGWREKRVIVTNDYDFLDDRRFPSHRCPGVLIIPGGRPGVTS